LTVSEDYITDLVCPIGKYQLRPENNFLVCINCGTKFPLIEEIPVLLIDEAVLPAGVELISGLKCRQKN